MQLTRIQRVLPTWSSWSWSCLPWLNPGYRFLSLATSTGITAIALYGLAILFGQAGIMSVGHAALMGVGAYTGAIFARDFGIDLWLACHFAQFCRRCRGPGRPAVAARRRSPLCHHHLRLLRLAHHHPDEWRNVHRRGDGPRCPRDRTNLRRRFQQAAEHVSAGRILCAREHRVT